MQARYRKWRSKYGQDETNVGGTAYNDLLARIPEGQAITGALGRRSVSARLKNAKKRLLEHVSVSTVMYTTILKCEVSALRLTFRRT